MWGDTEVVVSASAEAPPGADFRNYDVYAFVFYPPVDVFEVMFTADERVDAQVHQRARLNAERSAGYRVKPYAQFVPRER